MPTRVKQMFIGAFARLPQIVFWKWETTDDESMQNISPNVKLVRWLPQQDLLGCLLFTILYLILSYHIDSLCLLTVNDV